jgi:membrane-bound ClpP family serine protease
MSSIIIFGIIGVICVGMEVFLPGGVLGVIGSVLMLASVYFAYKAYSVLGGAVALTALGIITFVLFKSAMKLAPKTSFGKALFLQNTKKGESVSNGEIEQFIGKDAVVVSNLRPSGIVKIDGRRYNAITQGSYIEKRAVVRVISGRNSQLGVEKVQKSSEIDNKTVTNTHNNE